MFDAVFGEAFTGTPTFLETGTGGFHKDKDPNVAFPVLMKNWVKNTVVLYIGKAGGSDYDTTLSKRLKDYLRFGKGASVGHYGGRLIWQIKNSGDLLICWKTMISGEPRNIEADLISEFVEYYTKKPFANLIS